MKVLLIIEQCNPNWPSVPLVGYNFFNSISKLADVRLVTHIRNKNALEKVKANRKIVYISESKKIKIYYKIVERLTNRKNVIWPLAHALTYPIYAEFNKKVYKLLSNSVKKNEFDIVHSLTPILPRYPVKIIDSCKNTPFILGPVNGGLPFPKGFKKTANKEFAYLNFLRAFSLFIPGYKKTYKKADKILSGSTYTLNMIKKNIKVNPSNLQLFFENGISNNFIINKKKEFVSDKLNLLFVGRLVPYKGADMLIFAINKLKKSIKKQVNLTIVGDGPEKTQLTELIDSLSLKKNITFTGWIDQKKTLAHYKNADIFCFPSIREFGGAVVVEAMACGLPCIVINHGGIGEYVTPKTGFRINPISREHIISILSEKILLLAKNKNLCYKLSEEAIKRAKNFTWDNKAKNMIEIYRQLLDHRGRQ